MSVALSVALPAPRGPISAAVLDALSGARTPPPSFDDADPLGEDVQLALHVCYELHYHGFLGVDPEWEWSPELLAIRAGLERAFAAELAARAEGGELSDVLDGLLTEPVPGRGLSHFLKDEGQWWQMREFFVHRSIYHLKEADPYAWVIPRLTGRPKAALVAVEFDEFGAGHAEQVHAHLFARLLAGAELSPDYLHYLEHVPACALAPVNMMSLFGLHRRWRAALVGHFAAAEITSSPSSHRMDEALTRLDAAPACRLFYTEHVEADAVHEQIMRHEVIGGLLDQQPELAGEIVLGIQATEFLEARLADHMLDCWRVEASSLRRPL